MKVNACIVLAISSFLFSTTFNPVHAWTPLAVKDDPLVRMPGTQPEQGVQIEDPGRCLNCHAVYNTEVDPGFNWKDDFGRGAYQNPCPVCEVGEWCGYP